MMRTLLNPDWEPNFGKTRRETVLRWSDSASALDAERAQTRIDVLEWLSERKQPVLIAEIAAALCIDYRAARTAVTALRRDGCVRLVRECSAHARGYEVAP